MAAITLAIFGLLLIMQTSGYTMEDMCAQWSGSGYIGNPTDCTKWGYCQNQKLVSWGTCGANLVYDSPSGTCQYNTKVACSTSVTQTCSKLTTPGFMADPNDCTQYAYCFGNGTAGIKSCPKDQTYAANNNTCVWGPTCAQDSICRFMQSNIYVGDPNNCGQYLQCIKGAGISGLCKTNFYYNAATGNCQNTNPCDSSSGSGSGSGSGGTDTDIPAATNSTICGTETSGYVADGATCYGYYLCSATDGVWGSCPFGTVYDDQKCVSPASLDCAFNRCQNTNMTYAAVAGTNCKQYTYCPNGDTAYCNSGYPFYDEVNGKCVTDKPDYPICETPAG